MKMALAEAIKSIVNVSSDTAPGSERVTTSIMVATTSPAQIPTHSFIPGMFFT